MRSTAKNDAIPFVADGLVEARTTKLVPASLDEVWRQEIERMLNLTAEDRTKALTSGDFESAPGKYRVGFHLSKTRRVIAVQGGWWYRGVTCAEVDPSGTRVTYVMVNVAPGLGRSIAHFFQAREAKRRAGIA